MTSPIAPVDLSEMTVCVIGSDPDAANMLGQVIREYAASDVDVLMLDRRGVYRASRGQYGLVVFDARPSDPVALVNDLGRRLAGLHRRRIPVVVCHSLGWVGPVVDQVIRQTDAHVATRPLDAGTFMRVVAGALGTGLAGEAVS
jgi:hypothetical protein